MAMPMMIVEAGHMGKRGDESPAELDADKEFLRRLESLRLQAAWQWAWVMSVTK
jgi:2-methylaconitate cis-trans-isomerase PrpF